MRKVIETFLLYIFVFLIITYGSTVWFKISHLAMVVIIVVSLLSFIYTILQDKKNKYYTKLIIFILIYFSYVLIYIPFGENVKHFLYDFIFIIISMILFNISTLYYKVSFDIWVVLNRIMRILVLMSLFFYFLGTILKFIHPTSVIDVQWGFLFPRPSYFGLHYDYQNAYIFGHIIPRNSSIFLEAGIFCFYIIIGLIIELFYFKKKSWFWILIFIIGDLTTLSTTGNVLMSIVIFIAFLVYRPKQKVIKVLKFFILLFLLIIVVKFSYNVIASKVNNESNNSYSIRLNDIRLGFYAFSLNKDFGLGYKDNSEYMNLQSQSIRGSNISGGSNGWMIILYQGGIYLFILYALLIYASYYYLKKNFNRTFVLVLSMIFVIELASIPLQYFWFAFWFCSIGFMNIKYFKERRTIKRKSF